MIKHITVAALVAVGASAQALVIDDFSSGAQTLVRTEVGTSIDSVTGTMLGGARRTTLNLESTIIPGSEAAIRINRGFSSVALDPFVKSNASVQYGQVPDLNGDLNVNLSAHGDRFRFRVVFNDLAGTQLRAQVFTRDGGESTATRVLPAISNPNGQPVDLMFSEFAGNARFDDVDRIVFTIDPPTGGDVTIDSIEAVPEPATIAAVGIGLAALARRRRSK